MVSPVDFRYVYEYVLQIIFTVSGSTVICQGTFIYKKMKYGPSNWVLN